MKKSLNSSGRQHLHERLFRDVRFEGPGDRLPVMVPHRLEEAPRQPPDESFLAIDVAIAESSRRHSADMAARFEQRNLQPMLSRCNRGHCSSRGAAVNDDVEGTLGPEGRAGPQEYGEK